MHIHLSNANYRFLKSCALHRRKFTLFLILLLIIRYASLPISSACRKAALSWISPMSVTPPQKSVFASRALEKHATHPSRPFNAPSMA